MFSTVNVVQENRQWFVPRTSSDVTFHVTDIGLILGSIATNPTDMAPIFFSSVTSQRRNIRGACHFKLTNRNQEKKKEEEIINQSIDRSISPSMRFRQKPTVISFSSDRSSLLGLIKDERFKELKQGGEGKIVTKIVVAKKKRSGIRNINKMRTTAIWYLRGSDRLD